MATHPLVFADVTDPLEADSWLHTMESKFGLLHCTEYQKTLYEAQQLSGSVGAWWLPICRLSRVVNTTLIHDGFECLSPRDTAGTKSGLV
jgi:hypothetical protein